MGRQELKSRLVAKSGGSMTPDLLRYQQCGLNNIFLRDGFDWQSIDGEIYLSIADLDGLHRAIGLRIVLTKKAPTGDEMRFLRNELDMSQSDLGKIIGVSDQSIARWEKSQTDIPGPAVFSVKFLYLFALMPAEDRSELGSALINLAMELGQADEISDRMEFTFADAHWVNAAP